MKTLDTVQANPPSGPRAALPSINSSGLIIRQKEPRNLEFPFDRLDSYLTPAGSFYIRSHFTAPRLQPESYRLSLEAAVKNPFAITYDELKRLPAKTIVATLECAGNSRVFLVPQMAGAQWELGVARFGLFLRELQVPQGGPIVRSAHGSLWFGTALVLMGVIMNLLAALQHTRFVHRCGWDRGCDCARGSRCCRHNLPSTNSLTMMKAGSLGRVEYTIIKFE